MTVEAGPVVEISSTTVSGPWPMDNPVRNYDWGSTSALAHLQGRLPSGRPEAELWMGAHPSAPSRLQLGGAESVDLAAAVERSPATVLGRRCFERFGPRLPFLLKVLAVDRALSVQVHPSAIQAADGFAQEQADRVPLEQRRFVDPFSKPEMLVPVSDFTALAGLRAPESILELLDLLAVPELQPIVDVLTVQPTRQGAAQALAALATWPMAERVQLAASVSRRATDILAFAGDCPDDQVLCALRWVLNLAGQHEDDPLVVAPLILQLHRLCPGQALFLPHGVPHAYLSGIGVEVMGSSDNVVRCGLTTKRVDGPALVEILDPEATPVVPLAPVAVGAFERRWQPPVPEFALSTVAASGEPVRLAGSGAGAEGPQVLLCIEGEVTVFAQGRSTILPGGRSAFIAACDDPVLASGRGVIFRATIGDMCLPDAIARKHAAAGA